jgi:hypothetical protein
MSLTTLATVKAFKNITGTQHDAEIARLILAVDAFVANYVQRTIEQATVTEYHSTRSGQVSLRLRQYPVASITSLYDDAERVYGSDTVLAASDYVLEDANAGIVTLDGTAFDVGINNVKVVYVAGYATVPADLAQAAVELVWLTRDLGDKALLGIQSQSIADGSVTTYQRSRLDAVRDTLERYTKVDR